MDGGAWVQDGAGIAGTGYTATAPGSGVSLRYRVKAADARGAESPYSTGPAAAISYNADPELSGTDADLGRCAAPPSYSYTVEDEDAGDSLTLTESLDGRALRTVEDAVRAQTYTATISAPVWLGLPNGAHTLTIAASDGQGGAALRTLTFTKAEDELLAYRGQSTVQRPNKAQVSVSPNVSAWPEDATVSIYLANNGNDAADDIVWTPVPKESIGDGTRAATYVMLDNTVKGQGDWCLAVKVAARQGASGSAVQIARLVVNATGELEVSLDGDYSETWDGPRLPDAGAGGGRHACVGVRPAGEGDGRVCVCGRGGSRREQGQGLYADPPGGVVGSGGRPVQAGGDNHGRDGQRAG